MSTRNKKPSAQRAPTHISTPPAPQFSPDAVALLQQLLAATTGIKSITPLRTAPPPEPVPVRGSCVVDLGGEVLCGKPAYAKGMCSKHYHRNLRHKSLSGVPDRVTDAVHVATSVPLDAYRLLETAATRNNLSVFRALRWVVTNWAEIEKLRPSVMNVGQLPEEEK